MGKVKSAVITAIVVAAIVITAFFATVSFNVAGTGGVDRYNSFISSITLGGELTGNAYAVLYPEGVISASDYEIVVSDKENSDSEKYENKYIARGGVYVAKDKIGYELNSVSGEYVKKQTAEEDENKFKSSIQADADVLNARLGEKGYAAYSVSVEDGFSIKLSVPSNLSYAEYKRHDNSGRSDALSEVGHTVQYLLLDGKLGLRNGSDYDDSKSLVSIKDDFETYFKSISTYSVAGNYAVKMVLTDDGFEKLNNILTSVEEEETAYFFVGETNLGLTLTMGSSNALSEKTLFYSADKNSSQDFAILLSSVLAGNTISNSYNDDSAQSGLSLVAASPENANAAIFLFVIVLVIIAAAVAGFIVKYKKLGLVNAIIALAYSLVMVTAIMLLNIRLTVMGAFTAILGLALLEFTNIRVFEAVRKETGAGRTVQASVKLGYKKTLLQIMDLHIILLVVSVMLLLIGVGEVSACGFILFVSTLASYVLYWATRFMWYVISSPVRDKFKFCGFKREVYEDDED